MAKAGGDDEAGGNDEDLVRDGMETGSAIEDP